MSKISKGEWLFLYIIAGIIDLIQIVISLTGIGIAISAAADPIIGIILVGYFQIRGVSMIKHPSRLISLLGVAGLEFVTGSIAPAWIIDIWYINRTVKAEEAQSKAQFVDAEIYQNNVRRPLYNEDGVRLPQSNAGSTKNTSLNINGVRPPKGGLK